MSYPKKIIESVLLNKPYSIKTLLAEAMKERIGLILEQELERLAGGLLQEKMDPVGKEDGDIDNDGDKDESDIWLAKRRQAIAKNEKK